MTNPLSRIIAEFLGAFTLVFGGVGAFMTARAMGDQSLLLVGLGHGLAIFVMVAAFLAVSGAHFNPAVSFAMLMTRRMPFADFIAYVAAQLAGATAAAALLKFAYPTQIVDGTNLGALTVYQEITPLTGLILEAVMTFILVLVIFGVVVDSRANLGAIAGLPIGMVIVFNILVGGPITGAGMNPARWFGPAVLQGQWADLTVYIVGPLLGALLAAFVYDYVIAPRKPEAVAPVTEPGTHVTGGTHSDGSDS
jgi:MIP family channel proteins